VSIEDAYNFRRIDGRLTTSGFMTEELLAGLHDEGYDVVVNLLPDDNDRAVVDEGLILEAQGIEHVHIPVDFAAPTVADFEQFSAVMDAHAGQMVHVHCAANWRVTAFYGLYAVRTGTWSEADADALVRGIWDPSEHPAWAELIAEQRALPAR
jgi:protein tyrosine phosphatase (PTP) superfamily phosphohydrolase (DUF442 family)